MRVEELFFRKSLKDFLRRSAAAFAHLGTGVAGTVFGTLAGLKYVFQGRASQVTRNDEEGKKLAAWLSQADIVKTADTETHCEECKPPIAIS